MTTSFLEEQRKKDIETMEGPERGTLEKFVKLDENNNITSIDWEKLILYHENFIDRASEGVDDEVWLDMIRYLERKGKLSYTLRGEGFYLNDGMMNRGPRGMAGRYNFTAIEDARKFRDFAYRNLSESIRILQAVE